MAQGDISLASVSSDPSMDLGDSAGDYAVDYSSTATAALQLGTELAAAISGQTPAPAVVSRTTVITAAPESAAAANRGGKLLLILLVVVIAIVAFTNLAD